MLSLLFSATFVFLQLWDPSYGCDQLDVGKGVDLRCALNDESVPCESATTAGTKAYFECRDGYERAAGNTGPIQRTCLTNGKWSGRAEYLSCDPVCGRIFQDPVEVTLDDRSAKQVPVPWHAEIIYLPTRENNFKQETVCYGTLISDSAVLTAAHCLSEVEGYSEYNVTALRVVLGNSYSDFHASSAATQIRKIAAVVPHVDVDMTTSTNNVVVLHLDEPVDLNESVNRVCLPNGDENDSFFRDDGSTGWVPAFSIPEDTLEPSPIVLRSMPYISDEECVKNIPSDDRRARYFDRISPEKFCGGVDDCESAGDVGYNTQQTVQQQTRCPDNWLELNNTCYHVSHERTDWDTARLLCQNVSEGAELASIHNDEQFGLIASLVRAFMWIGLNSLEDQNTFVFSDGTSFDGNRWRGNQPNNLETERCGQIYTDYWERSGIENADCNLKRHFACSVKAEVCPSGWEKAANDYCYFASTYTATWGEARTDCKRRRADSDLASFSSDEEYNAIVGKTQQNAWIGLVVDKIEDGGYNGSWSDGTEFDYDKFGPGEPNFLPYERCVEVRKRTQEGDIEDGSAGYWNDRNCASTLSHVCAAPLKNDACLTQIKRGHGYGLVDERNGQWYLEGVVSATYDSLATRESCRTDVQLFARVDNFLQFIKEALEPSNETS